MRVHSGEAEATKQREGSILTSGRAADGEVQWTRDTRLRRVTFCGEDEETITGGQQMHVGLAEIKSGNRMEFVGGGMVVQGYDVYRRAEVVFI